MIEVKQHEFFPNDAEVAKYFEGLSFSIGEAFRLLSLSERTVVLGTKIVTFVQKKNLGSVAVSRPSDSCRDWTRLGPSGPAPQPRA